MTEEEKLVGEEIIRAFEISLEVLDTHVQAAKKAVKNKIELKDYHVHVDVYEDTLKKQRELFAELKAAFNNENFNELTRLTRLINSYSLFIEEDARLIHGLISNPKLKPNKDDLQ